MISNLTALAGSGFLSQLFQSSSAISISDIIIRLLIALAVSLFIYFIYKFTFNGVTFNRNFGGTIVITTVVTAVIMMIINSTLALSLGMVGALSIIRFRNAVKDSRDISFIFWGVASGLAAGTGLYLVALISTVFIGLCVVVFNLTGFSSKSYLLVVRYNTSFNSDIMAKALNHYCKKYRLRMKNTSDDTVEAIYELNLRNGADNVMVEKIADLDGILSVNLVSSNEEI